VATFSQLIKGSELSEYVDLAPGVEVSRSISDGALTDFGGGHFRFVDDAEIHGELTYDEVVHVLEGRLEIEAQDGPLVAGPGDTFVLKNGASATYRGTAGTSVFYVLHPRVH
jgi:ethanolamine utilization protein EutQ (cupin superfamily)